MDPITNIYIEPTSHCNLSCEICSRNHWKNEEIGHMTMDTFGNIISNVPDSVHRIFFSGVGEPLCHPNIIQMIRRAKETGRTVGMITNGTLLDKEMGLALIDSGLDELWVSMDSIHEKEAKALGEDGENISVLNNVKEFIARVPHRHIFLYNPDSEVGQKMNVGIAFVLTKSNLEQFRELVREAHRMGISEVKATHLIPYETSQLSEVCYDRLLGTGMFRQRNLSTTHIDLPLMEEQFLNLEDSKEHLIVKPNHSVSILGNPIFRKKNWCKFIEEGYTFVRWDGEVSPCVALLHDNHIVQQGRSRYNRFCTYGNVNTATIQEIWDSKKYSEFRQRVKDFNFSPCVTCGPCDLFERNETDCEGSPFPTCGACLWAQGLFQCP